MIAQQDDPAVSGAGEQIYQALEAGASGYLLKSAEPAELIRAMPSNVVHIEEVRHGDRVELVELNPVR